MKILLIFIASLFITHSITAQTSGDSVFLNCIAPILKLQDKAQAAQKTTGINQRLVAIAQYSAPSSSAAYDSIYFRYSSERGSTYDLDLGYQYYPGSVSPALVSYDSAVYFLRYVTDSVVRLDGINVASYDIANVLTELKGYFLPGGNFNSAVRLVYHYNALGKKDSTQKFILANGNWKIDAVNRYTYDSQNRLLSDSTLGTNGITYAVRSVISLRLSR